MQLDQETAWLVDARHVPSPNHDERPDGVVPSLFIVHGISLPPGEFGGPYIEQLFSNTLDCDAHPYFDGLRELRVSAHALVRRDGEVLQFVPFTKRAWHAGQSVFAGREACNDFSIGVELEGTDDTPYTDAQYRVLAEIVSTLRAVWPAIDASRVVGHCDVAPGRKSDPGEAFDWERFRALL